MCLCAAYQCVTQIKETPGHGFKVKRDGILSSSHARTVETIFDLITLLETEQTSRGLLFCPLTLCTVNDAIEAPECTGSRCT